MRRVDDPLLLPRAPSDGARAAEGDAKGCRRARAAVSAARSDERGRLGERLAAAGAGTSTSDAISSPTRCGSRSSSSVGGGFQLLEPVRERERLRVEDRELLLDRDREVRRRRRTARGRRVAARRRSGRSPPPRREDSGRGRRQVVRLKQLQTRSMPGGASVGRIPTGMRPPCVLGLLGFHRPDGNMPTAATTSEKAPAAAWRRPPSSSARSPRGAAASARCARSTGSSAEQPVGASRRGRPGSPVSKLTRSCWHVGIFGDAPRRSRPGPNGERRVAAIPAAAASAATIPNASGKIDVYLFTTLIKTRSGVTTTGDWRDRGHARGGNALALNRQTLQNRHAAPSSSPGQAPLTAFTTSSRSAFPSRARGIAIRSPPAVTCNSSPMICSRRRGKSRRPIELDEMLAMRSAKRFALPGPKRRSEMPWRWNASANGPRP